ncbi:hypothetical protein VTN49DRAFT_3592 [Thermomyces lanuginosus]|uniref:uncharacterized protein n=1 Tax=Thermomyces lanuginosus TaxID=5541 RepID=UPI0037440368
MAGVSKACCSLPPVVSQGYEPKGEYKTIAGLKTYVTGPADATKALLVVFDIFGFFPQTLQGSDILSTSDADNKYRVFIPDFFEGEPCDISVVPPKTDEQKQYLSNFLSTKAAPAKAVSRIPAIVEEANKLSPSGSFQWGILGYCWGAKVASLTCGEDSQKTFKAAAQVHPSFMDPEEAKKVGVPMALLPSKDEDPATIQAYADNLTVPKLVETYSDMVHGWMAARANLEDPEVRKQYQRGYQTLLGFFRAHL